MTLYDLSIQKLITKPVIREDRAITSWHISKLGSCLTGVYLERLGVKPDEEFDERTLRIFEVGKVFENIIVGGLKGLDKYSIREQERVESERYNLSGYIDVVLIDNETKEEMPLEIKSKHSKAFWYMTKESKPMRHHEYQLWTYMWLKNYPVGKLIYISKDDNAIQEFYVKLDDEELKAEVMNEITILSTSWIRKEPPPPIDDPKDWRYKYCRFHKHCLATINKTLLN